MAAGRSFTDYVANKFYNNFYEAVEEYIEKYPDELELAIRNVKRQGEISLADMEIQFVSVRDFPDMKIAFDVVVDAEIVVAEGDYHYDDYDQEHQWFLLSCSGDLLENLDDFEIRDVSTYSRSKRKERPLSDSLVPYIKKEELEEVALEFLKQHYPEALKKPIAIEPVLLAEKMGLSVELRDITDDFSIFGQIYFHDTEADFYNPNTEEYETTSVKAKTIFVDPKAFFLRNLGAVNNTIVHECVHWDKHRKAFELERLYNSSASKIKCRVVGGIKDDNRDATDWMEWQANALAPKIQMPLGTFKTKAYEYIKQFAQEKGGADMIEIIEPVIDALATFFGVSRLAAKIRMVDAGYEEAIGTFTYIDGKYVRPHRFKKGALERNQTFSIPAEDAAIQSATNPALISLIKDGAYQYVDAHFVLNHPKYITRDLFGEMALTDYARTHMDECCLIFDLSVRSSIKERYYTECYLNRDESSKITLDVVYGAGYQHAPREKQIALLAEELEENARMYSSLPNDPVTSMQMVKKWRNVTFQELSERTLLSDRTIRRIVNGEEEGSLNSRILICLALHLPPEITYHIIGELNYRDENNIWYNFAIRNLYGRTMDEIRNFLKEHGAESL